MSTLTWSGAQGIVEGVMLVFRSRNMPIILEGFAEDAEVVFGPTESFRGRDRIEEFLTARFARQVNHRLEKELRMVDGNRMAVAWWDWWDDPRTLLPMHSKGIETWTVEDGLLSRWDAAVDPAVEGRDPTEALGLR